MDHKMNRWNINARLLKDTTVSDVVHSIYVRIMGIKLFI